MKRYHTISHKHTQTHLLHAFKSNRLVNGVPEEDSGGEGLRKKAKRRETLFRLLVSICYEPKSMLIFTLNYRIRKNIYI